MTVRRLGYVKGVLLSLAILVGLALPLPMETPSAGPLGSIRLLGPAMVFAQTPCTTHVYEVLSVREDDDPGNDNCPSNNCTPDVYVRTFVDGIEVSFQNAYIVEPMQWENCYLLGCSHTDPFSCVVGEYHPCASPECTSYMVDCAKQAVIEWWNDSYAPANGLPSIGQETNECDEEPDEDDDECKSQTGAPINVTNGNMYHAEHDITLKIPGIGLNFSRYYNSKSTRMGSVGYGWTHNFEIVMEPAGTDKVRLTGQTGRGLTFREYTTSFPVHGHDEKYLFAKFGRSKDQVAWDYTNEEYTWTAKNGMNYQLNSEGKATIIQDGRGNELTLVYDPGTGFLESVTDNFGRSLQLTYYVDGKLETVTDPAQNTVRYHYTGDNLTRVDYPDGRYKSYRYQDPNDSHNLTAILFGRDGIDPTQVEYQWSYDNQDRAVSSSKANGNEAVTLEYISDTQTEMSNSLDQVTTFTFERVQGRLKITDVDGPGCPSCGATAGTSYVYDPDNQNLLSTTDGEGNVTLYTNHDTFGQPWSMTEASGTPQERTVNFVYHPYLPGAMTTRSPGSVLNPGAAAFTVYDYDDPDDPGDDPNLQNENPTTLMHRYIELGWTKRVSTGEVYGLKKITRYYYNDYGQVIQIDGPRGDVSDVIGFGYDPASGDLLAKTEPLSGTTGYSDYDDNGNVGAVTDVNNRQTTYTYDERNRIETVTQVGAGPGGTNLITTYVYEDLTGYRNPEADDLIIRIRQEYDFERKVALCHRLHAIIAGDQPYTFLYVGKWTAVLDRRIVIRDADPEGRERLRPIQPTRTGNYMFTFNQWTKLAEVPQFDK